MRAFPSPGPRNPERYQMGRHGISRWTDGPTAKGCVPHGLHGKAARVLLECTARRRACRSESQHVGCPGKDPSLEGRITRACKIPHADSRSSGKERGFRILRVGQAWISHPSFLCPHRETLRSERSAPIKVANVGRVAFHTHAPLIASTGFANDFTKNQENFTLFYSPSCKSSFHR